MKITIKELRKIIKEELVRERKFNTPSRRFYNQSSFNRGIEEARLPVGRVSSPAQDVDPDYLSHLLNYDKEYDEELSPEENEVISAADAELNYEGDEEVDNTFIPELEDDSAGADE